MRWKQKVNPGEGWPGRGQAAHSSRDDFRKREAETHAGVCDQEGEREERKQWPRLETKGRKAERGPTGPREVRAESGLESQPQQTR